MVAFCLFSNGAAAQNVSGFLLGKIQNFRQTSPVAPVVDSAQPFQFGSVITMGTATINSAMATFTGTSSPRSYMPLGNGDFSILDTFTTQAQLDAAYQTGNYSLSINTSAGTFSRSIFMFPFSYPTTPMLTLPANAWQSGMVVIDPAADYNVTWNVFSNAQPTDVIELVIGSSTFGPFPATQTSYLLAAGTLQPGSTYSCGIAFLRVAGTAAGDANIGAGYAVLAKNTGFTVQTEAPTLALVSAVSRKVHGAAGSFDTDLPLSGSPGVECRAGGATGDHNLVVSFTNTVVSGAAIVLSGTGTVAGNPVFSGNTMTVNLTGVANAQTIMVRLDNVTDQYAQVLPLTVLNVSFLLGDTNGNGAVTSSDISQTKAQTGQATNASNFRTDVNVSGSITSSDISLVKASSGTSLP
jgi:hypothetical protein